MFEKPENTEETIIDKTQSDPGTENGFSEDLNKYGFEQPKKEKRKPLTKTQKTVITTISCVLAVLVLVTGTMLWFPSFYFSNAAAMTVNGMKIPVYEYNFNYWTTVQLFYQAYGAYISDDVLDPSKDLAKQQCPSTVAGDKVMTWQDYFLERTDEYVESIVIAYQKSVEMGFGLTESDQKAIDSFFEVTIPSNAERSQLTEDEFIRYTFGTSCNQNNLRTALEHIYIAQHYNDYLLNSYTVEQTELDDWMKEYKDQFWGACYHYYEFKAASNSEENIRAAKQKAHDFLNRVTDPASFADLAYKTAADDQKEKFESETATLRYYFTADEISDSDISNWLFDESRKPGDKEVVYSANSGAAYALYFVEANYPPSLAANLYSIYLGIGDQYADENAAQAAAQAVQAKFIEGGKTAEVFKKLAAEYSDNTEADEDGGYFANFLPKDMDQDVAIWCYTTGRELGEFAIIESSYGGYYFVYLESWGDPIWKATAIEDIQNYHYMLAQDEIFSNVKSETTFLRSYMVSR